MSKLEAMLQHQNTSDSNSGIDSANLKGKILKHEMQNPLLQKIQQITAAAITTILLYTAFPSTPAKAQSPTENPKPGTIYLIPNQAAADEYMKSVKWDEVKEWCHEKKENEDKLYTVLQNMGFKSICRDQFSQWMDNKIENGELIAMGLKYKGPGDFIATVYYSSDYEIKAKSAKGEWGGIESTAYTAVPTRQKGSRICDDQAKEFFNLMCEINNWKHGQMDITSKIPKKITGETGSKSRPKETPVTPPEQYSPSPKPTEQYTPSPQPEQTSKETPKITPSQSPSPAPEYFPPTETPKTEMSPGPKTGEETRIMQYRPEGRIFLQNPLAKQDVWAVLGDETTIKADESGAVDTYICVLARDTKDDRNFLDLVMQDPINNYSTQKWAVPFEIEYTTKQLDDLLKEKSKGKMGIEQFKKYALLADGQAKDEDLVYKFLLVNLKTHTATTKERQVTPRGSVLGFPQRPDIKLVDKQAPITLNLGFSIYDSEGNGANCVSNYNYSSNTGSLQINVLPTNIQTVYRPTEGGFDGTFIGLLLHHIISNNPGNAVQVGPGTNAGGGMRLGPGTGP